MIVIINKLLLLHLVGYLCYCISDARSHKHQIQVSLNSYNNNGTLHEHLRTFDDISMNSSWNDTYFRQKVAHKIKTHIFGVEENIWT